MQGKVGREEEGSSSNRPELAAFLLALHDTLIREPLLYLCDNRSLLKAVTRWIGEGGKATLVGSPDADILAAAIEILRKKIAAGTATFLRVPWRHKMREMMAIAGIILVAKWLANIKQRSDVSCRLCKRAREQRGASTENLTEETYGHINSAFCDGMATTVTVAHHFIWRYLYASMQAAQTPMSKLRFVAPDKESIMSTL